MRFSAAAVGKGRFGRIIAWKHFELWRFGVDRKIGGTNILPLESPPVLSPPTVTFATANGAADASAKLNT